jgi:hypothetical protein
MDRVDVESDSAQHAFCLHADAVVVEITLPGQTRGTVDVEDACLFFVWYIALLKRGREGEDVAVNELEKVANGRVRLERAIEPEGRPR